MQIKTVMIIAVVLAGCKGGESTRAVEPETPEIPEIPEIPEVNPEPVEPLIPLTPTVPEITEPYRPIVKPITPEVPQVKWLPEFTLTGIEMITEQPFKGVITQGGNAYLSYPSVEYFQDFTLPEWTVSYKYKSTLEIIVSDGVEELCIRYDDGFGYGESSCVMSDTRLNLSLEDIRQAYYGFEVVESRVRVNGVVGLSVGINY